MWSALFVCLVGFLTPSSTTGLYNGRALRQSVCQFYVLPHMGQSWETMTSVSAGQRWRAEDHVAGLGLSGATTSRSDQSTAMESVRD